MNTVYMTLGLPASGKTTWAREKMKSLGENSVVRVNKDDMRAMFHSGKWSKENEAFVLRMRDAAIGDALANGKNVIVDDTNIYAKHRETVAAIAREHGAKFEIVDFTNVPPNVCVARDAGRGDKSVGARVIWRMYRQLNDGKDLPAYAPDPSLPVCLIVDVDGTIANANGRDPFDETNVMDDLPRTPVILAVKGLANGADKQVHEVFFFSGRTDKCYDDTLKWITRHVYVDSFTLTMRKGGDQRPDTIVKREMYDAHVAGKYSVLGVFDDRESVCEMWDGLGLTVFRVGRVGRDGF